MKLLLQIIIVLLTTSISISTYCEKNTDKTANEEKLQRFSEILQNLKSNKGSYVTDKAFESTKPLREKRFTAYIEWKDSKDVLYNLVLNTSFFFWIFNKNKIKKAIIKEKQLFKKREDTYNDWWYGFQNELDKASYELEQTIYELYHKNSNCKVPYNKEKSVDCKKIKKTYISCLKSSITDGRNCSREADANSKCMHIELLSF